MYEENFKSIIIQITTLDWHNWSARETLNLKVVGSSPTFGCFSFCLSFFRRPLRDLDALDGLICVGRREDRNVGCRQDV